MQSLCCFPSVCSWVGGTHWLGQTSQKVALEQKCQKSPENCHHQSAMLMTTQHCQCQQHCGYCKIFINLLHKLWKKIKHVASLQAVQDHGRLLHYVAKSFITLAMCQARPVRGCRLAQIEDRLWISDKMYVIIAVLIFVTTEHMNCLQMHSIYQVISDCWPAKNIPAYRCQVCDVQNPGIQSRNGTWMCPLSSQELDLLPATIGLDCQPLLQTPQAIPLGPYSCWLTSIMIVLYNSAPQCELLSAAPERIQGHAQRM